MPIAIDPATGPVGTKVDVTGSCYFLHSGHEGTIYFDSAPVADVRGDTDGNYDTAFTVLSSASPGPHTVSLRYFQGSEIGAVDFLVSSTVSCVGDCNGDGVVTIHELISLVNIALGNEQSLACPNGIPSGDEVTTSLIIQAVNYALSGCEGG